jgi:replicative DNA helicase
MTNYSKPYHYLFRGRIKTELKSIKGGYKDIDVVTVSEQLNQKGILEDVGAYGVTYLTQLAGSVPTTANTIYYCDLVKSKALRRRGIEATKI